MDAKLYSHMVHKNFNLSRKTFVLGLLTIFFLGFVFHDEILLNYHHIFEDPLENEISYEDLSPIKSPISSDYTYLNPQMILNESQLADFPVGGLGRIYTKKCDFCMGSGIGEKPTF